MTQYEKLTIVISTLALLVATIGLTITLLRIKYTKPRLGNIEIKICFNSDKTLLIATTITNKCYYDFSLRCVVLKCNNLTFPSLRLVQSKFVSYFADGTNIYLPSFQSPTFDIHFDISKDFDNLINHKAVLLFIMPDGKKKRIKFLLTRTCDFGIFENPKIL